MLSWRGSLGLIRSPLRLGWGILLSGAGALFIAVGHGHRGTVWGGALILYLAAGALLEPLRLEVDSPAASHLLLPWPYGRVLWLHCLLPTTIMALTGIVTVSAGWAAGYVSLGALVAFLVTVIPVTLMVVLGAALSARRGGRVPVNLVPMTAGDSTGLSVLGIVAWIFAWAVFVVAVLAVQQAALLKPVRLCRARWRWRWALSSLLVILNGSSRLESVRGSPESVGDSKSPAGVMPLYSQAGVGTHDPARPAFQATGVVEAKLTVLDGVDIRGTREGARLDLAVKAGLLVHDDVGLVIIDHILVHAKKLLDLHTFHRDRAPFQPSRSAWVTLTPLAFVWVRIFLKRLAGGLPSTVKRSPARPVTSFG